ncbi:MAG: MarR family transcriptional regulator [Deltaproteobacteria bacterium]|nr:MarR family transcriptional regulator [Deltaproteobacteria bacterium]
MGKQIGIYRGNITPEDRLLSTTVGRQAMLDDLLEKLGRSAKKKGGQHYLFIGPRGIGKTHFLSLIDTAVKKTNQLNKNYTVIRFPEESHRILSYADFLLGVVEILGEATEEKEWQELYRSLSEEEKDDIIIDTIEPRLKEYQRKTKKTLLILLENLDTLFTEQIKQEQDIHRFRSFLMDSPCATLIGASPVYFPGLYNTKSPLYEFFDIQILEDLTEELTLEMIRKNLEWEGRKDILKDFDALIPKIQSLHTMTSGNPRLIMILYKLIAHDNILDVKLQFQKLLDQISPFYQDRLKDLAPQERALLENMALMRTEPRTPASISKKLRMPPQQTSSLLKRMTDAGYLTVSENPQDKRSRLYRIKEGFFDLWLAMSLSRTQRKRLPYLVEFFEAYYRDRREREEKRTELWQRLGKGQEGVAKINDAEILDYLSEIGDEIERCQTKIELAVHRIKAGDKAQANDLISEIKAISPSRSSFVWMTEQADLWAKEGIGVDAQKWLDGMIEYWRTQRSGDLEKAVEIAFGLGLDLFDKGLHKVFIELMNDALEHTQDPNKRFLLLVGRWTSQMQEGQYPSALESLKSALALSRQVVNKAYERDVLKFIGLTFFTMNDYESALSYLQDSIKLSKIINDTEGEVRTLHFMALTFAKQDNVKKELETELEAYQLATATKDIFYLYHVGINLGRLLCESGEITEGLKILKISLGIGKKAKLQEIDKLEELIQKYEKESGKPKKKAAMKK